MNREREQTLVCSLFTCRHFEREARVIEHRVVWAIRKLGEPNAARLPAVKRTMAVSYNTIAGQSVERRAALSDGVLAVAMTLLLCGINSRHEK